MSLQLSLAGLSLCLAEIKISHVHPFNESISFKSNLDLISGMGHVTVHTAFIYIFVLEVLEGRVYTVIILSCLVNFLTVQINSVLNL